MSLERKEIFEFGEFRLDVDEHTIERIDGSKNSALTGKAFQVLVLLVRRRGHLVSKDELIRYVWPDTIVEDNNLEKCVHHLRQFLGETNGTKYIETVRKHGYRFVGNVKVIEVSQSWLPETLRGGAVAKTSFFPRAAFIILAMIVSMAGMAYYLFVRPNIKANTLESNPKGGTNYAEARQFYMMAMNLSDDHVTPNVLKSLEYLERAITLDPNYAHAWAAKALVHRDLASGEPSRHAEHYQKSMEALGKALEIDPNISEAYSALCLNKNRYEYDVTGAEAACKRAVELDPNSPVPHRIYCNFLYSRGRFDEAIVEIKRAMDIQPVSYRNQQVYALALYYARRYDESEVQWKRLMELNRNLTYIHGRLIMVLEAQGKDSEAFEYLIKMLTIQKADTEKLERFNAAYKTNGWRGVVIEQIKIAETESDPGYFHLACLHAKVGEKDKAFRYLEKAYQERNFQISVLQVEPQLDPLHDDPRWAQLVARVENR